MLLVITINYLFFWVNKIRLSYYIYCVKLAIIIYFTNIVYLFDLHSNLKGMLNSVILEWIFVSSIASVCFILLIDLVIRSFNFKKLQSSSIKYPSLNYLGIFLISEVMLYIILFMMEYINNSFFINLFFIGYFVLIGFLLYSINQTRLNSKNSLSLDNVNLENCDILKNNVFVLSISSKKYQIFKLNFSALFPNESENHYVFIENKEYYIFQKQGINVCNDYIYLSITKLRQNIKLKVYFGYTINEKKYDIKCDLYLEIKLSGDVVYISKYQFRNFVRRQIKKFSAPYNFFRIETYPLEYHVLNSIKYYDKKGHCIQFEEANFTHQDTRKWLLHNGAFGSGKTTVDINYVAKNKLEPVIISPWEDNYDEDILQLIYAKISKNHSANRFVGLKNTYVFLVVIIATLFVFLNNSFTIDLFELICHLIEDIMCTIEDIMCTIDLKMDSFSSLNILHLKVDEIRIIILLIISFIISIHFLPQIILLKKDNTKYYQEFYVKKI